MRIWIKAIFALLAIAALLWLATQIGSFSLNILSAHRGGGTTHDPQFAEEIESITPPPELYDESASVEFKDNSANWDTSIQTPVDQTAAELGEEARNSRN